MKVKAFLERYGEDYLTEELEMKEAVFEINGAGHFKGYHNENIDWNGWRCPYFTKEVGLEIINHFDEGEYREEEDAFYFNDEVYRGKDLEIEGKLLHLYPIGAYHWIWDKVNG